MFERFRKYRKLVIVIATICVVFGVLCWRYYHVNSFYFAYQHGEYRKAMEQIWTSPGISYVDLEKAGIQDVDVPRDMPDPKSFDFRFEKQGKIFHFLDLDHGTVLSVRKDNNDGEGSTVVKIDYKNKQVETIDNSGVSESQIKHYKKFSVQYMYDVEKKLYKYLDQRPRLRILKMIPFYGYFQKR